jgi:hypothetical protein
VAQLATQWSAPVCALLPKLNPTVSVAARTKLRKFMLAS